MLQSGYSSSIIFRCSDKIGTINEVTINQATKLALEVQVHGFSLACA